MLDMFLGKRRLMSVRVLSLQELVEHSVDVMSCRRRDLDGLDTSDETTRARGPEELPAASLPVSPTHSSTQKAPNAEPVERANMFNRETLHAFEPQNL